MQSKSNVASGRCGPLRAVQLPWHEAKRTCDWQATPILNPYTCFAYIQLYNNYNIYIILHTSYHTMAILISPCLSLAWAFADTWGAAATELHQHSEGARGHCLCPSEGGRLSFCQPGWSSLAASYYGPTTSPPFYFPCNHYGLIFTRLLCAQLLCCFVGGLLFLFKALLCIMALLHYIHITHAHTTHHVFTHHIMISFISVSETDFFTSYIWFMRIHSTASTHLHSVPFSSGHVGLSISLV